VQRSKIAPKTAAIFVASCLTREPALINDYHAAAVSADLLGIEGSSALVKLVKDLPPTGDGRAQVITFGVVLGALESRTPKDAWRRSGGFSGYGHSVRSAEYLAFLVANGYQLAEVERVIVGERTGDEVYDETLSTAEDTDPDSDEVEETEPDTGDDPDSDGP
jgi:ParB family transcriptional regulator, chromosome partitioning protein